jgi:hypothetical protein
MESYELSEDDLEIIGSNLRETRDRFRSFEHDNIEDNLIDQAYAGRIQNLLERLGQSDET